MTEPRLDAHGSKIVRDLFEENTAEIGSVGDIVDKHAGDAVFLTPDDRIGNDADGGESDFAVEMLPTDPAERWESVDDEFAENAEDEQGLGETDITGTAAGIARGFGSHLPLDMGAGGFQIEELPQVVLDQQPRVKQDAELDDYDDDDETNGVDDPGEFEQLSIPGSNRSQKAVPQANEYETPEKQPITFEDQIDSAVRRQ